jgi:formylglycine-generating enzyme required for sulfatase activity/serine/threonine protein kinase
LGGIPTVLRTAGAVLSSEPEQASDVPLDVLPPGTVLHGYEILAVLGQGGFGITYRARHASLGREVAIKEYLPRDFALRHGGLSVVPRATSLADDFRWVRDRFLEEARTLVKLEGVPGIVRVLDLFEANGTAYSVMALARGETLERRLERSGALTPAAVEHMLWPLLDGLEQVHAVGFVHRDIKPGNIILDAADRPTLIDFGAARMAAAGGRTAATMTAMYTPAYAAPEQFASAKQGPWTDIYGLAATLYCAVTGTKPPSAMERSLDDVYEPLVRRAPPGFPPALLAGIDAGMKLRPADRPQSIAAWRGLLQRPAPARENTVIAPRRRAVPAVPPPATAAPPPTSTGSTAARQPVRWKVMAIAAAVLLLGAGVYAGTALLGGGEARRQAEAAAAAEKAKHEQAARQTALEAEARRKAEEAQAAEQQRRTEEETQRQAEAAAAEQKKRENEQAQRRAAARTPGRDCAECPEMVPIPAGTFTMGVAAGEEEREKLPDALRGAASPQRSVRIDAPFSLARHEVTRAQYRAFVKAAGYEDGRTCAGVVLENGQLANKTGLDWTNPGFPQTDDEPVVCVSWADARAYVDWLAKTTGKPYRLPTEAEWEYAARAGTTTAHFWGDDRGGACGFGNVSDRTFLDWGHWQADPDRHFACTDGFRTTAPVGRFRANPFGLHDMLGNAWEWVEDCWNDTYREAPLDQQARATGRCEDRVLRGASWLDVPSLVRVAVRTNANSGYRYSAIGFRVARGD